MSLTRLLFDVGVAAAFYLGATHCIDTYFNTKYANPSQSNIEATISSLGTIKGEVNSKVDGVKQGVDSTKRTVDTVVSDLKGVYREFKSETKSNGGTK